jgi:hypothetical protein
VKDEVDKEKEEEGGGNSLACATLIAHKLLSLQKSLLAPTVSLNLLRQNC